MGVEIRELERGQLPQATDLLARACAYDRAAEVAEEKLFLPGGDDPAHPVAAWRGDRLLGLAVGSGRFLRLLAVAPGARAAGVGTALLERAIADAASRGHHRLVTMAQPGNYLAPGVDCRNRETIAWLERRGFSHLRDNENLLIDLADNPKVTRAEADARSQRAQKRGFSVQRIDDSTAAPAIEMAARLFSPAGASELARAARRDPPAAHLAVVRASGAIAAFAAHDGNNAGLGWFGPAGTDEAHRGSGLGAALLLHCLLDVRDAGHEVCEVAWIGPAAFYDKVAGPCGRRRFSVHSRSLP